VHFDPQLEQAYTTTHLYEGTLQTISFFSRIFLLRTLPHLGGTQLRFSISAQELQHLPQPFSQVDSLQDSLPQDSQAAPQCRGQPGSGAQKSSHLTTHTIFLISFISHTTRQYFSQQQWHPQWAQQSAAPQVCTSLQASGAGAPPRSAAFAPLDISNPIIRDNVYVFILISYDMYQAFDMPV